MSRNDPSLDSGFRVYYVACGEPGHPEGEHHHLSPLPDAFTEAGYYQTLDSKGVRVDRCAPSCSCGIPVFYSHVTTTEERMQAARQFARFHIGDPRWADAIMDAYHNPWDAMERIAKEEHP